MEEILNEQFIIDDDAKAEWALRKIRERNVERDRIVETARRCAEEYTAVVSEEERKAASDNAYSLLHPKTEKPGHDDFSVNVNITSPAEIAEFARWLVQQKSGGQV